MSYVNALNESLRTIGNEARWCVWKYVPNKDKPNKQDKIPLCPMTGKRASVADMDTWSDFDSAYQARERLGGNGYGFLLGGGFAGIDIDNCIDDNGQLSDMAGQIIERLDSYTEKSPSGKGIHILCRVPDGFLLDGKKGVRKDALGLEIYCEGRYLTVTGNVYGGLKPIEKRDNEILNLYREYFSVSQDKQVKTPSLNVSASCGNVCLIRSAVQRYGGYITAIYPAMITTIPERI